MAAVDDIYVGGADSMRQIAETVANLLSKPSATANDGRSYITVDAQTQVALYPDDDEPGNYVLEVYHAGAVADRQHLARRIFNDLVARTSWDLTLVSDDEPGSGIVAERVLSASK